ncbi:MAG: hypothetical protein LCH35_13565 [Bacteroidetes bacterium]|jgi:hypothetical protein|uniref:hypothetical protein n=1 Tax=Flavobacterium sp. TaxID=239 RepID=UPI002FD89A0A|nr:hypothetical protein [Bacteroidota bacterium]
MKKVTFIIFFLFISGVSNSFAQSTGATSTKLLIDKKTNCQIRYYYYPNLQAYFDLLKNVFYYQENGSWNISETLPKNYGGYSLYKMNHVSIRDYDDDEPYKNLDTHKKLYPFNFRGTKM